MKAKKILSILTATIIFSSFIQISSIVNAEKTENVIETYGTGGLWENLSDCDGNNNEGVITGVEENIEALNHISELGVINNEAFLEERDGVWDYFGDSIDIAFLALGEKVKVNGEKYQIISKIPYESINQYSAVIYEKEKETRVTSFDISRKRSSKDESFSNTANLCAK